MVSLVVIVAAIMVRAAPRDAGGTPPQRQAVPVNLYRMEESDWNRLVQDRTNSVDGSATLVVFVDYECPFCAALHELLDPMTDDPANELTIVYRQRPLSIHPAARFEAEVAACLEAHGQRTDLAQLYEHSWIDFPESTDPTVRACVSGGHGAIIVDGDLEVAAVFRVDRTPMLALNGYWLSSTPEREELQQFLEDIRAGRKPGRASVRTETTGLFP